MARKKSNKKRMEAEETRLKKIFEDVDEKSKETISGLIKRAAFMQVSLEDLEEDISKNGFTELFSQGDQEPYQRERPAYKIYCSMNTNYQKIIKQITDLIPEDTRDGQGGGDSFEKF